MTYKRKFQLVLEKRLLESSPLIQVIIGPRQVGKTTAIRAAIGSQAIYQTADSPISISYEIIQQWWEEAVHSKSKILAIDEVQKIEGWAEVIKKLWDTRKDSIKLILSGSAALSIEKNLKETLSGRFELIRATHWNFKEYKEIFNGDLKNFIEFGCYPGAEKFKNDLERWGEYIRDSIVEPAIGRDILQLHPIENPALLRQVFSLSLQLPAHVISLNKLQSQLQDKGVMATIQHYLNLLSSAFLVSGVQKFSPSGFRIKSSPSKIIIHDNSLLRAFERPISTPITNPRLGHYFENAIGARFIEAGWDTFYWVDRKNEVDFIVFGPNGEKWAIEVKSSSAERKEFTGLFEFCKINPEFQPCLLSLVDQKIAGVTSLDPETILSL